MGQAEKDFLKYYSENMEQTPGIRLIGEIPKSLWGNVVAATVSLSGMCTYVVTAGEGATVKAMLSSLSLTGGAYGAASSVVTLVGTIGGCVAAYYLGACIGSTMVAAYKIRHPFSQSYSACLGKIIYPPRTYNGRFPDTRSNHITITEASNFLRINCSNTRMPYEVQKVYHKYPELLKCH